MVEGRFFKPLSNSSTTLKIKRVDIMKFPATPFYAVLWNKNTYSSFDDAYLADAFELVKVTAMDFNADDVDDAYGEMTIDRGKGATKAKSFTGAASNYRVMNVDNLYMFNASPTLPKEVTVSGTDATITHNFGTHPSSISILNADNVEQGKSQFAVEKIDNDSFKVTFNETVTDWTIRYKL